MHTLLAIKSRKYFRVQRGAAQLRDEVSSVWRAHAFVEARLEIGFHADTRTLDHASISVMLDALRERAFDKARAIAARGGFHFGFTITGTAGYVCSERYALAESKQRYEGILDDLGETLAEYNERSGNNFRSEARAEMQMWRDDADINSTAYPGLDVHDTEYRTRREYDDNGICTRTYGQERVLVTHSCGCLHDEIAEAFPEYANLIPWHLNDMRRGDGTAWLVEELPDAILNQIIDILETQERASAKEAA